MSVIYVFIEHHRGTGWRSHGRSADVSEVLYIARRGLGLQAAHEAQAQLNLSRVRIYPMTLARRHWGPKVAAYEETHPREAPLPRYGDYREFAALQQEALGQVMRGLVRGLREQPTFAGGECKRSGSIESGA